MCIMYFYLAQLKNELSFDTESSGVARSPASDEKDVRSW